MTIVLMFIFFSLVCGEWLGNDDAGLDEVGANEFLVFALEHLEGVFIARRYRDNQRLVADWGDVPEDIVFASPKVIPPPAPDECVAEVVDAFVG